MIVILIYQDILLYICLINQHMLMVMLTTLSGIDSNIDLSGHSLCIMNGSSWFDYGRFLLVDKF